MDQPFSLSMATRFNSSSKITFCNFSPIWSIINQWPNHHWHWGESSVKVWNRNCHETISCKTWHSIELLNHVSPATKLILKQCLYLGLVWYKKIYSSNTMTLLSIQNNILILLALASMQIHVVRSSAFLAASNHVRPAVFVISSKQNSCL